MNPLELLHDFKRHMYPMASTHFWFYVELVHHFKYKHAKHTRLICEKLHEVETGKCKRLMIFLPPRHSKSNTVTESFPSYYLQKHPNRNIICVSYGDRLAKRFGRKNRQKIQEFGKQIFGVELSRDNKEVTNFSLEGHTGQCLFTGLGGSITGQGAHLLVLDDVIKNRKEGNSQVYRDWVWEEYQSSLLTRLAPNGAVVLIMTRWHEDDLAGRLLSQEGNEWEVIKLPAIAEEGDLLGRAEGEPLWAEYGFDKAWAEATKKEVGSLTWASLYQQRPSPMDGNIFKRKWFQFYKQLPDEEDFEEWLLSVDATFKDNKDSDYCVLQVWGRIGADKYLIDQVREQMSFTATVQSLRNICAKYPRIMRKLIEDKANGSAILDYLKHEIEGLIGVNPEGSKIARAFSVQPTVEAGNVYIPYPNNVEWVDDFLLECCTFPNGSNDDQVDAMTQALHQFSKPFDIFIGRA